MLIRPLPLIVFTISLAHASPILVQRLYPDPEPCLGNCSWVHDPNIYVQNGTYYRFSTSGNIAVATAERIGGPWRYVGALLGKKGTGVVVDGERQDVWAPNVVKIDETFYCHYSVSYLGTRTSQIGLATSPSLSPALSTWTDHGSLDIPQSPDYNLIDPAIFQEAPSAPVHMTFGSYWSGIFSVKLTSSTLVYRRDVAPASQQDLKVGGIGVMKEVDTSSKERFVLRNLIRNTRPDPDVVEGAFMYKHAGAYFLFYSAGACCATPPNLAPLGHEYRVMVCKAPTPSGNFVDAKGKRCDRGGGTLVLGSHGDVYAPGGQGVTVDGETGREVLYYHYVRPSVGYAAEQFLFGWNYLEWRRGWPVIVASEEGSNSSAMGSKTGILGETQRKLDLSFEGRPMD